MAAERMFISFNPPKNMADKCPQPVFILTPTHPAPGRLRRLRYSGRSTGLQVVPFRTADKAPYQPWLFVMIHAGQF